MPGSALTVPDHRLGLIGGLTTAAVLRALDGPED